MTDDEDTPAKLEQSIGSFRIVLILVVSLAVGSYIFWFWFIQATPLSVKPDHWGQFGDFIGGILNPTIAYAAFLWITRSVKIQARELSATRKALKDAAEAQTTQAKHAHAANIVAALTCQVQECSTESEWIRKQLEHLANQYQVHDGLRSSTGIDGQVIPMGESLKGHLADLRERLLELSNEKTVLINSLIEEVGVIRNYRPENAKVTK